MKPSEYLQSVIDWLKSKYETEFSNEVRQTIIDNIHYLAEEAADHMQAEDQTQESD